MGISVTGWEVPGTHVHGGAASLRAAPSPFPTRPTETGSAVWHVHLEQCAFSADAGCVWLTAQRRGVGLPPPVEKKRQGSLPWEWALMTPSRVGTLIASTGT